MRWPWSSSDDDKETSAAPATLPPPPPPVRDDRHPVSWTNSLNATNWSHYTEPRTVIPTLLLTGTTLFLVRVWKTYLRRIPQPDHIKPDAFRKRTLFGKVTSVGDADNFRLFHTPGGRLAGWGWLRRVPKKKEQLRDNTIHVRLAGVDAPELAHFGRPAQPYSQEALTWLTSYILNRRVRAHIWRRDQYDRVVATVFVRKWLIRRDVGYEMLKRGLATVYEAKAGSEFGAFEDKYRAAEKRAKDKGIGLWADSKRKGFFSILGGTSKDKTPLETPRQYKTRMRMEEEQAAKAEKGTVSSDGKPQSSKAASILSSIAKPKG